MIIVTLVKRQLVEGEQRKLLAGAQYWLFILEIDERSPIQES